jgi:trigger factor
LKVTVARNAGSVVEMDIAAEEDEFAKAMNQAYRRIVRDINIPGFRKGKAPRHIVERMVGKEALIEEAGMGMMDELYRNALTQEGLVPVAEPEVNVTDVYPIAFHVSVQVYPEVTLGDYQSVRVEPREVNLEDGAVDETIETLRKNVAEWIDLDEERSPETGDQVTIDMIVYEGDDVFQDPAEDMPWVLGEAGMFEALEDAIKEMSVGERTELTLAFDDEDETVAPEVRGKTLRYDMTLKGIKIRDLPEVDDEFAAKVGGLESVDQLRSEVRKDLLRNRVSEAQTEVMNEIVNNMAEISEVDVPEAMVDTEVENQITQTRSRLAQSGMDLETFLQMSQKTEDDLRAEIREDAARRVRNSLVLQKITEAEDLKVTPQDIAAEIDKMTAGMENPERMRSIYESDYFRERLEDEIQDRKITERILEIATEGRGAVTGEGAELANAEPEAAEEQIIDVEQSAGSDDDDRGEDSEAGAEPESDDESESVDEDSEPLEFEAASEAVDDDDASVNAQDDDEEAKTDAS